jgi:putative endonuclease
MPFVYIIRCSDQTLYVGHTNNLAVRERVHNEGFGARYTAARRPVMLVYSEWHDSVDNVLDREQQLKH